MDGIQLGIDINANRIQISCITKEMQSPETISTRMGIENYEIPLCMYKREDANSWMFGQKAMEQRYSKEGVFVDDLWEGTQNKREIVIDGETYPYSKLLTIFLGKALQLVAQNGWRGKIESIVFTMAEVTEDKIHCLLEVGQQLSFSKEQIYITDYMESFGVYAVGVKRDLWKHSVLLLYYEQKELVAYRMQVNERRQPCKMKVQNLGSQECPYHAKQLEDDLQKQEEMDTFFLELWNQIFQKQLISTVYLIGEGFETKWMKRSLKVICAGRRVFQGNNLFSKGACYVGELYRGIKTPVAEYKSSQALEVDVRIPVFCDGEESFLYAGKRGEHWYHAGFYVECMPGEEPLQIQMTSGSKVEKVQQIDLEGLPKREANCLRLGVEVSFMNAHTGKITVKDLGFGEFYPPSGFYKEQEFYVVSKGETIYE